MKKRFLISFFALSSVIYSQQLLAQSVTWQPAMLKQNQKVSFSYQAKGGDLEYSDEPKATIAVYNSKEWKTAPVLLKKNNDTWTGTYQLPPDASFIALKFYQGSAEQPDAVDNNHGKGYFNQVVNEKNKLRPGTYFAEASFRAGTTEVFAVSSFVNPSKDKKMIDSLLNEEEKLSGNPARPYLLGYLNLKKLTMPAADFNAYADELLQKEIKKGNLSETFLAYLNRYYTMLQNKKGEEMVRNLIFKDYPESRTARLIVFTEASMNKTQLGYAQKLEAFLKRYPYAEWKKHPDESGDIYYQVFQGLANYYYFAGQMDSFISIFKDIDFKTANEIYRLTLTKSHLMNTGDPKVLYPLSTKIIAYLLERQKDNSYLHDFSYYKQEAMQKGQENANKQMDDRLFTHIYFANKEEDYANAKRYFQYLSKEGAFGNADLNALHMQILEKLNDTAGIRSVLESSVAANRVTPAMFGKLKEIYIANRNGKADGYEKYLSSLTPDAAKTEMRKEVMANMVDYPLTPFSLEDADGKMVNSKDWAGKIVVVDFWATWCRPCIMAFPGMQMLIDQYAKDPQVAVYMIGTMQTGDYKTKSVNFVRSEGYRFNLLHDAVGPNGSQSMVFRSLAPLFKSSGIPRKIIIKDGKVRYTSEGYSGSPSQLKDELSMAIEILRAEK